MISLILGPVAAGKTTELIRRLERGYRAQKLVILLRPSMDTRPYLVRTTNTDTSWLDQKFVDNLEDFNPAIYNIIAIDEGQFHTGLVPFCKKWSLSNKKIIVSALHATSECEMFDRIISLIPYCEEIVKLNAVCTECGSDVANYSYYKPGNKTKKEEVGGDDKYTSLCFRCYRLNRHMESLKESIDEGKEVALPEKDPG